MDTGALTPQNLTASRFLADDSTKKLVSGGAFNNTTLPAFLASAAGVNNITGDGSVYTIIYGTSIFDQASNYNIATGVFTAPITGRYFFEASVDIGGIISTHTGGQSWFVATSRNSFIWFGNPYAVSSGGGLTLNGCCVIDMTQNDTIHVALAVYNGTKVVGIITTRGSLFGGHLIC